MALVDTVTLILSTLTVGSNLFVALAVLGVLYTKVLGKKLPADLTAQFSFVFAHGIQFALIVAIVSMTGSLFYSDVALYEPCKLCW